MTIAQTPDLAALETSAVEFAKGAGEIALRHFRTTLNVEYKAKGNTSPVTIADKECEDYLRQQITKNYPTHAILGEEGENLAGSEDSPYVWVLDPIDGTANFISGLPLFAVSVGLLHHGEPVAAAIWVPTSGYLQQGVFHAHRGGQAFFEDTPVKVAPEPAPVRSRLVGLPSYFGGRLRFTGDLRQNHGEPRSLGSICVELCLVSCGTLQYSFFNRPKVWDVAAGVLIVRQAGGLTLVQPRRHSQWEPLNRFQSPSGGGTELDRLRNWGMGVVVANPEMAWTVATNIQHRPNLMRPVAAAVSKAKQLSLFRNGHHDHEPPAQTEPRP